MANTFSPVSKWGKWAQHQTNCNRNDIIDFDSLIPITSLVKNLQISTEEKLVYFPYLYYNPKGRKHKRHTNTYVFINMSLKTATVFNIVSKYLCKEQI